MANAFQLDELDGQIGQVTFNVPDKKVNTLSREVLQELAGLAARLEQRTDLRGLLLRSTKPGQFVAGADLNELAAMSYASADQVAGLLASGHQLFNRISRLPFPMVALIDGACMGGGTELALVMDERLVSTAPHTQISLPEVGLGLLPGWGGTQRLPRLIGLNAGIEMVCSSEVIGAQKAVALGFAFDAVPPESLVDEGRRLIEYLHANGQWKERRQKREQALGLTPDEFQFAFAVAEGAIKGKTKGQYPAPLVALKAIRDGCNLPLEEGLKVEQKAFQELHGSPIMANLIAIFFMKNRLLRDPGVSDPAVTPKAVKRVGVSGAGLMGAGIVAAHARSGIPTAMVDIDDARLQDGHEPRPGSRHEPDQDRQGNPQGPGEHARGDQHVHLAQDLRRLRRGHRGRHRERGAQERGLQSARPGDSSATRSWRATPRRFRSPAWPNLLPNPEQFIGMHFFSPVDRMELVEIIRGAKTSDETVATIVALARKIRKTPIVVNDCPGFLVNRVLFPYMNESLILLHEGLSMDVDRPRGDAVRHADGPARA